MLQNGLGDHVIAHTLYGLIETTRQDAATPTRTEVHLQKKGKQISDNTEEHEQVSLH